MILATNNGLVLESGFTLAIVDANGKIVTQGDIVKQSIFDALSAQVIRSICSQFTALNESDFKKSA